MPPIATGHRHLHNNCNNNNICNITKCSSSNHPLHSPLNHNCPARPHNLSTLKYKIRFPKFPNHHLSSRSNNSTLRNFKPNNSALPSHLNHPPRPLLLLQHMRMPVPNSNSEVLPPASKLRFPIHIINSSSNHRLLVYGRIRNLFSKRGNSHYLTASHQTLLLNRSHRPNSSMLFTYELHSRRLPLPPRMGAGQRRKFRCSKVQERKLRPFSRQVRHPPREAAPS